MRDMIFSFIICGIVILVIFLVAAGLNWKKDWFSEIIKWENFSTLIMTLILAETFVVVVAYTYETQRLRDEMVHQNTLSLIPVLDFVPPSTNGRSFTITNKGKGPAVNILMLKWFNGKFSVCKEQEVGSVLPIGGKSTFTIFEQTDVAYLKKIIKGGDNLIDMINSRSTNLLCLIYSDLRYKKYYTILNGTGTQYEQVFEFGEIVSP